MQFTRRIIHEHIVINRQWWCSQVGTALLSLYWIVQPTIEQTKNCSGTVGNQKKEASSRTHLGSMFFSRTHYIRTMSSFEAFHTYTHTQNNNETVRQKKTAEKRENSKKNEPHRNNDPYEQQ